MLSITLDTETTGVDLWHSCRPFLVTICTSEAPDEPMYWQWKVDPLTRMPKIDRADVLEIVGWLDKADEIAFQNAKFDIRALVSIGLKWKEAWWPKVQDTLYSGHLLSSGSLLNLTAQALQYLSVDIEPLEVRLGEVINECRRIVRREYPDWRIAKEDDEGLPSLGGGERVWKWDMWLGEALADAKGYPEDHEFRTATPQYALGDSAVTLPLRQEHKRLMEERGLLPLYEERRKLVKIIYEMESNGVTFSMERLEEKFKEFSEDSTMYDKVCTNIAKQLGFDVKLPKGATNKSILAFAKAKNGLNMEEVLLKSRKDSSSPALDYGKGGSGSVNNKGIYTKSGELSLNKANREAYEKAVGKNTPQGKFANSWSRKQMFDTALSYMSAYKRFGVELAGTNKIFYLLHPSLNGTGSGTLRMSSSNPNEQNISKKGEANLRYCFGPAPGREWWSSDFENLELRLPAYEAGEEEMIALFERPNDPPYYGSQHLLVAHILWFKEFEGCLKTGEDFKKKYKDTLYQWTKNGNFAVTYGAVEESGTADAAYHQPGAQRRIKERFRKLARLNESMVALARRQGYVTTMVDREIGMGYPLQIPRNDWGDIIPTTPLNYHVQGTAMWCTCKSMRRCAEYLAEVSRERKARYYMTMQVHDEIDFDFPKGPTPDYNLPIVLECKRLMELSGDDVGVPLRVDVSYHPNNWAKAVDVDELIAA